MPNLPNFVDPKFTSATNDFFGSFGSSGVGLTKTNPDLPGVDTDNTSTSDILQFIRDMVFGGKTPEEYQRDTEEYNTKKVERSYEFQKELKQLDYDYARKLRQTQMQDTIDDLKKAGINPSVYFGFGGNANSTQGLTSNSVNTASVQNPYYDTIGSLTQAYASVLGAVAQNKNADSAILRSIIGSLGNIFSVVKRF